MPGIRGPEAPHTGTVGESRTVCGEGKMHHANVNLVASGARKGRKPCVAGTITRDALGAMHS
jgi:hypothetical protein